MLDEWQLHAADVILAQGLDKLAILAMFPSYDH